MIRFANVPESGGFRLAVSPGGCSGLAAEFDVVSEPRTGDVVLVHNGLRLFLPAESRLLLEGVTIDCTDTPADSGFVFYDPKSSGSNCGTPTSAGTELVSLSTPSGVRT
jgi:iron-sulfur cluster assembly accessory protein